MQKNSVKVCLDFPDLDEKTWVFPEPIEVIAAYRTEDVAACLERLQAVAAQKKWVAGYLAYEAAPAFDSHLSVQSMPEASRPLLWFAVFDQGPERVERTDPEGLSCPAGAWQPDVSYDTYARNVRRIQAAIRAGDTYQVNYTVRLTKDFTDDPWRFYQALRAAQKTAYGMYIETPGWAVLSASPELFFTLSAGHIVTRPMKGTAPRGRWREEDEAMRQALQRSVKNRAENIMIADLLRNDLGKIARIGSVRATDLWKTERYPTVWQMTSTVSAEVPQTMTWIEVMRRIFPSGSITGAPKISTMRLIAALEETPRGVYCGTLGYAAPSGSATFNVAIRTVWIDKTAGR
ncbi:MAG: chorismate-binding protein, partial [Firmicutes bacterium]|nr:chorismate-binding protein [Bacillota bacterium]